MHVDDAGDEVLSGQVQTFGVAASVANVGDAAVFDDQRPLNRTRGQDQSGIRKDLTSHKLHEFGFHGKQAFADGVCHAFHEIDQNHNENQAGEHVFVAQHAACYVQFESDTAAAKHSQGHGSSEVDIESIKTIGHDRGQSLRQHRVADDLQTVSAGSGYGFRRAMIDVLDS